MSRLTVTSYYTRQTLKFGSIFLLLFFIFKISFGVIQAYWKKVHPPPPPPPNTAFGKLPEINFPESKEQKPTSFQLETIEGSLPSNIPSSEKVYYIPPIGGRFLSLDKATQLANRLGFSQLPKKITEEVYRFENPTNGTNLKINVLTENFEYSYGYLQDQTLISPPSLPPESEAINIAKTFLEKIEKLSDELRQGEYQSKYWRVSGSRIIPAISSSEADFIQINITRKKLDEKYPVLSPSPDESLISVLISGMSIQDKKVVEVKYTHFKTDREKSGTYPLKAAQQAWEEFQAGNYHLASFDGNKDTGLIKIRKVYLGYFDPPTSTRFLQPIFVFQGDNNFYGYIPAIPIEWSGS